MINTQVGQSVEWVPQTATVMFIDVAIDFHLNNYLSGVTHRFEYALEMLIELAVHRPFFILDEWILALHGRLS